MDENLFAGKFYTQFFSFFCNASFLKLNIKQSFSGCNSVLRYNLYKTILEILVDFILNFRKIAFFTEIIMCYVKFLPKKILKRTFLHLLMPNLLVYLILGSILHLPNYIWCFLNILFVFTPQFFYMRSSKITFLCN